ncbi:ABC transporter ATP-binding protein [Rhodopseudomonas pseudopalustris]|uniref:Spermidine/putrescine import ATP-binding protein PotA n=1 Tax=Rhodopseudomonas pseudopalustris TaxID=1513892 RepID=A0A1H8NCC8_9BRAD|nr:ABC transporter ATP-binding protein [Rhodopseudomonas pseudopalustris]MBB1091080.1 ABC transporter ATP-binding protein [Rhodopseudomonas palustris]SEO27351.1 putative spermidine/putrescine transport system ATP-binding protein [Rhodopseudomonas pseudopalustris]
MTNIRTNGAALVLKDLAKTYGSLAVVRDVSLTVAPGEFVTFLGPSGSGKTTTLNLIAGFTEASAGRITLDGRDLGNVPAHQRGIGVVFQSYALFPHMTVRQNIAYPLEQRRPRMDRKAIETQVSDVLQLVEMAGYADRRPHQLSGGQQQRVALARAVVFEPKLLLLDEPLGALDKRLRESLQLELRRIHRELGVTVIFVTHDQDEAMTLSDRIVVFNEGRIEQVGTPQQLYGQPATEFVARFLGDSNIFRGRVEDQHLNCGAFNIRLPAPATPGPLSAMVRPEKMRVKKDVAGAGEDGVAATLTDVTFSGSTWRVEGHDSDGRTLLARVADGSTLHIGEMVNFVWSVEDVRIVASEARP